MHRELAELVGRCAEPEFSEHLHVFDHEGILLQWYDAFDGPILLSRRLPPERVAAFCNALGRSGRELPASVP